MKATSPRCLELNVRELDAFLDRMRATLSNADYALLEKLVQSHAYVSELIENKGTTIRDLRRLFGLSTEKTRQVLKASGGDNSSSAASDSSSVSGSGASSDAQNSDQKSGEPQDSRPGHGRNGADAYPGAERIPVPHSQLKPKNRCPDCGKGKLYVMPPGVIVRIVGRAPLQAKVYELQKLRCNLCGEVFTADPPAHVGPDKYDATAATIIALFKYATGMPFNRQEGLQGSLGVPLPASTQWDIVHASAGQIEVVFEELIRQAAQGEVLHNDDTSMTILELTAKRRSELFADTGSPEHAPQRTGVFTSGIVSTREGRRIALFFTGCKHAGENLAQVLARRAGELGPPMQMCDALSRNLPEALQVILANCLAHGRRQFIDVAANFPQECRHVLETLRDVYKNDALAKAQKMSADERLHYHQAHSGPLMHNLKAWFLEQFEQRQVEPNSGLGKAIRYMLNHWDPLTRFLREPGAPLDNNICERALKKAILHRKNALFYKTLNGAHVGDVFMSLIHTCQLSGADPFDYLTQLLRHAGQLPQAPGRWMPWNYTTAIEPESAAATPAH